MGSEPSPWVLALVGDVLSGKTNLHSCLFEIRD